MTSSVSRMAMNVAHHLVDYKNLPSKAARIGSALSSASYSTLSSIYCYRQFSQLYQGRSLFLLHRNNGSDSSFRERLGSLNYLPRNFSSSTSEALSSTVAIASNTPASNLREGATATKTFKWPELKKGCCALPYNGDCHQIEGTLVLQADGKAHFSCVTWTDSTHSGDYWNVGFVFLDHSGVTLFNSPMGRSPRMDDGQPPERHRWEHNFTFDPSIYAKISSIRQSFSC